MSTTDNGLRPLAERVRETLAEEGRPPSRPRVERLILDGRVSVDGRTERDPARPVGDAARVSVDPWLDADPEAGPAPRSTRSGRRRGVAGGRSPEPPAWVYYADKWIVVVERGAFPQPLSDAALVESVRTALGLPGLHGPPGCGAAGVGPLVLAASRALLGRVEGAARFKHPKTNRLLEFPAPPPPAPADERPRGQR